MQLYIDKIKDIIQKYPNKYGMVITGKFNKQKINEYQWLYEYILENTKFLDKSYDIRSRIYCLLNNIVIAPCCLLCGKELKKNIISLQHGFAKFCSISCSRKNNEVLKKYHETCLRKYGVENYSYSNEYKERVKHTNIEKFGKEHPMMLEKYVNKAKNTCMNKYGTLTYSLTVEYKEHMHEISSILKKKEYETKKKNHSFNKSKPEDIAFLLLKLRFPNIVRQFRSEKYPYVCDFYIPTIEIYIEYNEMWTHGKHPFDPTNINDILLLNKWKLKTGKFYKNAIYTWTILDVKKRNIAKANKLKLVELWNLHDVLVFLDNVNSNLN